jgi:mycothiol synthase
MDELRVEQVETQPELLESVRALLPDGDPYLQVIEDHRLELRAHHHPKTFVVSSDEPFGYAMLRHAGNDIDASLDIVMAPHAQEIQGTKALLEHVLASTERRVSWWTRQPRLLDCEHIGAMLGGRPHRHVVRMERSLDGIGSPALRTRGYEDRDVSEIVRINNEAFAGHHDRGHLTEEHVHEQLRVFGNRFDDLRIIEGGFCWTKRSSADESELFVLAIDNEHQGQGLGPQLLLATCDYVRTAHGVHRVSLYVEHDNERAIALYERNGFTNVQRSLHSVVFPEAPGTHSHH